MVQSCAITLLDVFFVACLIRRKFLVVVLFSVLIVGKTIKLRIRNVSSLNLIKR